MVLQDGIILPKTKYWYVEEQNISCRIISLIEDRDHGVVGWDNTSQYLVQLLRAALLATASVWGICISIKMAQMYINSPVQKLSPRILCEFLQKKLLLCSYFSQRERPLPEFPS